MKDPIEKSQNLKFFWPRSRIGAPSSLESSMKRFLRRFELNQNRSKSMRVFFIFLHLKPIPLHCYSKYIFLSYINSKYPNSWLENIIFVLICFDSIQIFGEMVSLSFQVSMMSCNLTSKKFSTETEYGVWKLLSCSFTYQSKKNPIPYTVVQNG